MHTTLWLLRLTFYGVQNVALFRDVDLLQLAASRDRLRSVSMQEALSRRHSLSILGSDETELLVKLNRLLGSV